MAQMEKYIEYIKQIQKTKICQRNGYCKQLLPIRLQEQRDRAGVITSVEKRCWKAGSEGCNETTLGVWGKNKYIKPQHW